MVAKTLTCEDVIAIHRALVEDFFQAGDPISPAGVRSDHLLESAVARQHTALGGTLKYETPIASAATLLYGLCSDHPFHNGNKRTALVAMLVHLDENRLALWGTDQADLYGMTLAVADHSLGVRALTRGKPKPQAKRSADDEVSAITEWITRRCARLTRGERPITYRVLKRILESFGFALDGLDRNFIEVARYVEKPSGLFRRGTRLERTHITTIGWPGENREVGVSEIKRIRRILGLTESDGVDSDTFYDRAAVIDSYVNRYRKTLRRLGRR